MNYSVIGIPNNSNFNFSDEVQLLMQQHQTFSGGKRHYDLVKPLLPFNHTWIDIKSNMNDLFRTYQQINEPIVVFASGDPLFYGFANTIKKFHPAASVKVYSHFNSLQVLCQRMTISYERIVNVSVHGRSWSELDTALIQQFDLIGILTDTDKTPAAIARRMLKYNFNNYTMVIGEELEGEKEQINSFDLARAATKTVSALNCVLLMKQQSKQKYFGIPDIAFNGLTNRPNMITKMPVRLTSLSQLELYNKKTLWDIGFCTGSVAIEAKTHFPNLSIVAFEKRMECSAIFDENTYRFSTPGITKLMGDFFETEFQLIPPPDAVFIGGHANRLEALLNLLDTHLLPGGKMVMNAVKAESKITFMNHLKQLHYKLSQPVEIKIDKHNTITVLTAEKATHE